jgi:hypothetical protein
MKSSGRRSPCGCASLDWRADSGRSRVAHVRTRQGRYICAPRATPCVVRPAIWSVLEYVTDSVGEYDRRSWASGRLRELSPVRPDLRVAHSRRR